MSRKVFIVNNGGHDYSDATRYGELVFCTEGNVRKDDFSQMFRELSEALDQAEAQDYLLLTSLTSLCSIATGILADRFGEVHFLLFHNGRYDVHSVIFDPTILQQDNNDATPSRIQG